LFSFSKQAKLKAFFVRALKFSKNSWKFSKENLLCSLIESRLDILLFRLGFAKTLYQSRHFIIHKKVLVNNVSQKNSFFLLSRGDIISFCPEINEQIVKNLVILNNKIALHFPNLEINYRTLKIIFLKRFVANRNLLKFQEQPLNWINRF
jgi:ribosomal protein S4